MDASAIMLARSSEELHAAAQRMQLFLPDQLTRRALAEQLLAAYRGQVRGLLPRFLPMALWDELYACRGRVGADGRLAVAEGEMSDDLEEACLQAQALGLAFTGRSGVFLSPLLLECAQEAQSLREQIDLWALRVEQIQGLLQYHGMVEAVEMPALCREQLGIEDGLSQSDVILYLSSREEATHFLTVDGRAGYFVSPDLEVPEEMLSILREPAVRRLPRAVYPPEAYAAAGRMGYPGALVETRVFLAELTDLWGMELPRAQLMTQLTFSAIENDPVDHAAELLLSEEIEQRRNRPLSRMEQRRLHVAVENFAQALPQWRMKGHTLRESLPAHSPARILAFPAART